MNAVLVKCLIVVPVKCARKRPDRVLELLEVLPGERRALPEARGVGPHIEDPQLLRVALLLPSVPPGEGQDVGLHALGVEDPGGEPEDRVQAALVHEVRPDLGADLALEEHVVREDHGGAFPGFEAPVDVLKEGELLVGCEVGEVLTGGSPPALLRAEGRGREDDIRRREILPRWLIFRNSGPSAGGSHPSPRDHPAHQDHPTGRFTRPGMPRVPGLQIRQALRSGCPSP